MVRIMKKALKLAVSLGNSGIRKWTAAKWVEMLVRLGLGVGTFIFLSGRIAGWPENKAALYQYLILAGATLAGVVFTAVTSVRDWLSSPEAFHFITSPLTRREMYRYHWLTKGIEFLDRLGGHIIVPTLWAYSWRAGGAVNMFVSTAVLAVLISTAVNLGFFMGFYLIRHKNSIVGIGIISVGLAVTGAGFLYSWQRGRLEFGLALMVLAVLTHLGVPGYIERVFDACLDSMHISFDFKVGSGILKNTVLKCRWLHPVTRAVIYKELVTDKRNLILSVRFVMAGLMLLAYLPLARISYFSSGSVVKAVLFCYMVIVLNVHDGFAATFTKEGDIVGFLLPAYTSWRIGWAKFLAILLQDLPLVVVATMLIWLRIPVNLAGGLAVGGSLLLLCAAHLASIVALAARTMTMEQREQGMWAAMFFEQSMGNINPQILFHYMVSLLIPAVLSGLGYYLLKHPFSWNQIGLLGLLAGGTVIVCLVLGRLMFRRRLGQIFN